MGWHKFRRKIRCRGLRTTTGVTVDSGGVTVTAGGLTVTAGGGTFTAGNVAITAGGVDLAVTTGTTGTALANYGTSIVGTTASTAAKTYTIAAPTAGVEKFINIQDGSSALAHVVRCSTGGAVTYDGTNFIMTVTTAGDGGINMHLMGVSTSRWAILGTHGTLTFSTS